MAQIEKRKDGTYRIRVFCGYSKDGKKLTKSKTWHPPDDLKDDKLIEYEARKAADEFERRCRNGGILSTDKFADFCENHWFPMHNGVNQLKASTMTAYRDYTTRVYTYLGNKKLEDITPVHITEFINGLCSETVRKEDLATAQLDLKDIMRKHEIKTQKALALKAGISEQTVKRAISKATIKKSNAERIAKALDMPINQLFIVHTEDKRLSPKTIRNHFNFVYSVFKEAVRLRIIRDNPCCGAILPRYVRPRFIMLQKNELNTLMNVLDDLDTKPKYKAFFGLIITTGCRRGEIAALRWEDITNNVIHINKTVTRKNKEYIYDPPKTDKSNRVVLLMPYAKAALKELKAYQDEQAKVLGDQWHPTDQIFTTWDGHQMHPSSPYTWLKKACIKYGIKRVNIHSFRHLFASYLISKHTDPKTVQEILGHSQTSTTLDIYAEAFLEEKLKAQKELEDIINQLNSNDDDNKEDKNHD